MRQGERRGRIGEHIRPYLASRGLLQRACVAWGNLALTRGGEMLHHDDALLGADRQVDDTADDRNGIGRTDMLSRGDRAARPERLQARNRPGGPAHDREGTCVVEAQAALPTTRPQFFSSPRMLLWQSAVRKLMQVRTS